MRLNFVQDKRCNSAYSSKIMFRARLPERHAPNFTHYQYDLQGHSGANVKPYSENNDGLCTPSLITQEFVRATSGDVQARQPHQEMRLLCTIYDLLIMCALRNFFELSTCADEFARAIIMMTV